MNECTSVSGLYQSPNYVHSLLNRNNNLLESGKIVNKRNKSMKESQLSKIKSKTDGTLKLFEFFEQLLIDISEKNWINRYIFYSIRLNCL